MEKDFKFYEGKANLAHDNLPYARNTADDDEAKQTFEEFKGAADGMRRTGQLITEKLSANGRITEANEYKERYTKHSRMWPSSDEFMGIY